MIKIETSFYKIWCRTLKFKRTLKQYYRKTTEKDRQEILLKVQELIDLTLRKGVRK